MKFFGLNHVRIYWGRGGVGGVNPPPLNLSNPSYKVFNPTKILLQKSLTLIPLTLILSSLSGAACTPLEMFPPDIHDICSN